MNEQHLNFTDEHAMMHESNNTVLLEGIDTVWLPKISEGDPAAPFIKVMDKDGNNITKIVSYDTLTKEVVRYKTDENGKVISIDTEGGKELITETFIAEGSYLVFKVKDVIR